MCGEFVRHNKVLLISKGDADCILISPDGHHAMIDAGEKSDYETIKKTMKSRGVDKLDLLVKLPHHGDYFASLGELFKNSKVSYAVVSVGTPDRVDSKTKYLINGKSPKGVYTYDGTVSVEYNDGSFSIWQ